MHSPGGHPAEPGRVALSGHDALERLAALHGVETSYFDMAGQPRHASPEALLAVLQGLGVPVARVDAAAEAVRETLEIERRRVIEPVVVCWDEEPLRLAIRLPVSSDAGSVVCHLRVGGPEGGGAVRRHTATLADLPVVEGGDPRTVIRRLELPDRLPHGYHTLAIEVAGGTHEVMVIAAPTAAPARTLGDSAWGAFLPLYALHTDRSWGIGDVTGLADLADWVGGRGGRVIGTLPLLACFLDTPFDHGPYSPASRLFWNEIFIDVDRVPEIATDAAARRAAGSEAQRAAVRRLRQTEPIDYRAIMAAKRQVLARLGLSLAAGDSPRAAELRRVRREHPALEDYARFRAVCEAQGGSWQTWPERLRDGVIRDGDFDPAVADYHAYAQWVATEQIEETLRRAGAAGVTLYLDLPVGVHPSSYDVYRERQTFVTGASAGAPPDTFFTGGQDWGFPPLHPRRLREQRYAYLIAVLRHHLREAGVLRVDHVMWLHRLFYVPRGLAATEGVYVRYPHEELYALLCLEARRAGGAIIGEDLGTVPPEVRRAMQRHGIARMYVAQLEVHPGGAPPVEPVPRTSLASLNTHDMPTFAAFWEGLDIEDRLEHGLLGPQEAADERARRQTIRSTLIGYLRDGGWLAAEGEATAEAVLRAWLCQLAAGPTPLILMNLEDLWLERRPQNVPGSGPERPNWRRRAALSLEEMATHRLTNDILRAVGRLRHRRQGEHESR